jgi:hypothetical protein
MSEWLKEHAWKACVGETLPWVRIPLSPPSAFARREIPARRGEHQGVAANDINGSSRTKRTHIRGRSAGGFSVRLSRLSLLGVGGLPITAIFAGKVKTGARVQRGQLLAEVGDSHDAQEPHLDLEVNPTSPNGRSKSRAWRRSGAGAINSSWTPNTFRKISAWSATAPYAPSRAPKKNPSATYAARDISAPPTPKRPPRMPTPNPATMYGSAVHSAHALSCKASQRVKRSRRASATLAVRQEAVGRTWSLAEIGAAAYGGGCRGSQFLRAKSAYTASSLASSA